MKYWVNEMRIVERSFENPNNQDFYSKETIMVKMIECSIYGSTYDRGTKEVHGLPLRQYL